MHITIVAQRFPVRSQTFVTQHAIGLASKGHTVTVLSTHVGSGISNEELEEIKDSKVIIKYIDEIKPSALYAKKIWKIKRFIRSIGHTLMTPKILLSLSSNFPWKMRQMITASCFKKVIIKLQPDIVHFHFGHMADPILRLGIPIPTVITWHGYDAARVPIEKGSYIYRELFQQECIHTVGSSFMSKGLIELGVNSNSLNLIPMGVDISKFSYLARKTTPDSTLQIISVGRLEEVKGHRYLIEATASIIKSGVPVNLHIIGDGSLKEELSNQINQSGCSNSIKLLGAKNSDQILEELCRSDIFSLTGIEHNGRIETQGLVLIEAQSTGLPVVSSNIGGIPDSVIQNKTAILCEQKNIHEIKQALQFFIDNPQERIKYGSAGREFVTDKFSIKGMIERFEDVYKTIKRSSMKEVSTGVNPTIRAQNFQH